MEGSVDTYKKPSGTKSQTIDLDAKAKFESEVDMKNELKKIENIVIGSEANGERRKLYRLSGGGFANVGEGWETCA